MLTRPVGRHSNANARNTRQDFNNDAFVSDFARVNKFSLACVMSMYTILDRTSKTMRSSRTLRALDRTSKMTLSLQTLGVLIKVRSLA